ncbi:LysR substrate-binding domain-containing protein [Pigmentiphaga sp. GD03639]|uniref:LysR family transcriptional regulator n=1 Tax=Pigmentiphaga sp. GD03639 TaxID=2975354 RepID=UPI00244C8915|nr:LysR family transcriptional regulator [Pigmentiphaga sp. GD03639]MDH2238087.1 LysR substrate-binding domain-containing protein [Pigmentiphaga sp. GD03639]
MARPGDPISSVNLKLLHTFMLVGDSRSFRTAAGRAHRSGSAVSGQIRRLEEQLGVPLFHRTTRQVTLTREGEQLLQCVRRALQEVEGGLQAIQEAADVQRGRIALACAPTIAGAYLGDVLAAFQGRYPGIQVFVREITAAALFESVRQREVDFGISVMTGSPEFRFEPLLTDELVALVPRALLDGDRKTISLKALAAMPLLVLEQGTALRAIVEEAMAAQGLQLATRFQFMHSQTLISMATAGLGAAILPATALPRTLGAGVQKLRIVRPTLVRSMAIVTLPGHALSPAALKLVDMLRSILAQARA